MTLLLKHATMNASFASKSVSEIQAQLTSGLANVLSWLHANFLILNREKTKIILVGTVYPSEDRRG